MSTQNEMKENSAPDVLKALRAEIAARPWRESAEVLITDIFAVTNACTTRQLPVIEIKQLVAAICIAAVTLAEMLDRSQNQELIRLKDALQKLAEALGQRVAEPGVQDKYGEARVSSRRALCQNHDPVLDGFPKLVAFSREVCSSEVSAYMFNEVRLGPDEFLDTLQMMASDQADCATVANPPARIRCALNRRQARLDKEDRLRWQPATHTQLEGLPSGSDLEAEVITEVDFELAQRHVGLPPDACEAVEARFDGLNLQTPEAGQELGWDASRLAAVRRSLAADRRWGRQLRKRLSAYDKSPK